MTVFIRWRSRYAVVKLIEKFGIDTVVVELEQRDHTTNNKLNKECGDGDFKYS